jgi:hypothetical protein
LASIPVVRLEETELGVNIVIPPTKLSPDGHAEESIGTLTVTVSDDPGTVLGLGEKPKEGAKARTIGESARTAVVRRTRIGITASLFRIE